MKGHCFRGLLFVFLGAVLSVMLVGLYLNEQDLGPFVPPTALDEHVTASTDDKNHEIEKVTPYDCEGCSKLFKKVLGDYSQNWIKNEENQKKLRYFLVKKCNGFQKAFVTKTNTPLGTLISYDGDGQQRHITEEIFAELPDDAPFSDKILDTCAVVGNGGILANSSCGEAIDSAKFVIRCNMPPLENKFNKDVGKKTNLVTANPSIVIKRYDSLTGRRRAFVDKVSTYGDALLIMPAFSFITSTKIGMTVLYTLEDFNSTVKTVFLNPDYLKSLDTFWRSQSIKPGRRMSSGFMMVSLALELCNSVDVYGFWPFGNHPYGYQPLTNHYYDDMKPNTHFHAMPTEFGLLMSMHNKGVLRLHVGECPPQE